MNDPLTRKELQCGMRSLKGPPAVSYRPHSQRFIPSIGNIEKAMPVLQYVCVDQTVFGSIENFCNFANVCYFESSFFMFHGQKSTKLEFWHNVASTLKS